jgi:hypothetical protein
MASDQAIGSGVFVEHDLFGKSVSTFPDHAQDAAVAQPGEERIRNSVTAIPARDHQ